MSLSVTYGNYTFPEPKPFVGISDEVFSYSGIADHSLQKISIVGAFTGANIGTLYTQKNLLISGFSNEYQTLTVGSTGYNYIKALSIDFPASKQEKFLPYSVELQTYSDSTFSKFFGVTEPKNTWEFAEQENRIVRATHDVSAKGVKTSATDPLTVARNFVDAAIAPGLEDLSFSFSGISGFLVSKNESVNRVNNFYGVQEEYLFSTSNEKITNSGIVVANTQIVYSKGEGLKVKVQGSIQGGLTGVNSHAAVTTGMFTCDNARQVAANALERTKEVYESGVYGCVFRDPVSYNYNHDVEANKLGFNFEFGDPSDLRLGNILNNYTVSLDGNKDSSTISANINGSFKYDGCFDFFSGEVIEIEQQSRFQQVEAAFSGFAPYSVVLDHYKNFVDLDIYDCSGIYNLSPQVVNSNVTKNPFNSEINYSYVFDSNIDFTSGALKNSRFSINYNLPIAKTGIKETINGFATQKTHNRSLGEISLSASADNISGANKANVTQLRYFGTGLIAPNMELIEDNYQTSPETISINLKALY